MTNNSTLPATGDVYASEDRGGVKFQAVLMEGLRGPSVDAVGRWRISQPHTIFESKLLGLDDAPLFWEEKQVSGTSDTPTTPTAAKPYVDLASLDETAGVFVRQTRQRFTYQSGKSQLVEMTGVLELASGVKTGCERRIGQFDDDNGIFFESDAGAIGVTLRTNDSGTPDDSTILQANWNLDNLDGGNDEDNPSGILADWTKIELFFIDYEWLSAGPPRLAVRINGMSIYVHEFLNANLTSIPFMSTPALPIRYELITTADSGVCSMRCICSTVVSEGGQQEIGLVLRHSTAGEPLVTSVEDTTYALLGIRLKTTHPGTHIRLLNAALQVHSAGAFLEWRLLFNPTVAGTFTYSNVTNSSLQLALGATENTVTGGTEVDGGYLETGKPNTGGGSGGDDLESALILGMDIAGVVADEWVLCVRPIGGTTAATVEGSLTARETL